MIKNNHNPNWELHDDFLHTDLHLISNSDDILLPEFRCKSCSIIFFQQFFFRTFGIQNLRVRPETWVLFQNSAYICHCCTNDNYFWDRYLSGLSTALVRHCFSLKICGHVKELMLFNQTTVNCFKSLNLDINLV